VRDERNKKRKTNKKKKEIENTDKDEET